MGATLVKLQRTTYSQEQIAKGLILGWFKQFKVIPQKESVAVLYAQNALETGGTVSMWNNNFGNVKYVPAKNPEDDKGKLYIMLPNTWEILDGKKVIFQPPHKATWFRAFPTLADGVADHLHFLKTKRYQKAWVAIENGDPVHFAHLLKTLRYYTAPEADYAKSMNFFFKRFMKSTIHEEVVKELTPSKITLDEFGNIKVPEQLIVPSNPTVKKIFDFFKK